VAGYEATGVAG